MNIKEIFGYLGSFLAFIGCVPYFIDIYKGKTKPHAFTWLAWGVATSVGFAAALVAGGGVGAWALGAASLANFITAIIGFWQKQVRFIIFDWICLFGSLLAIILWRLTGNPLAAIILITLADAVAFLPSFRKVYYYPDQETISTFALSTAAFILSIFALKSLTITTWLYPAFIAFSDASFITLILIRRRQLKNLQAK